jgi:predicted ATPase
VRLKQAKISDFKRFTDLTVQGIPEAARLVMLAGPNGSGKSSFFDALYTWHRHSWRKSGQWDATYHRKSAPSLKKNWTGNDVSVVFHEGNPDNERERKKALYFRSAYRNEPEFQLSQLRRSGELLDHTRFNRMIDNDAAVSLNYQRLASKAFSDAFENAPGQTTFDEFRESTIGVIRDSFRRLFPDVELNSLGDPLTNGTFRFTKGVSAGFLFKNLSGGEKAAFDMILDLVVARREYDNTVFCIDEPELHMNMRLQAELLSVLFDLIPTKGQLMLATHSIGMMRRAREIETSSPGSVAFLDFGERDFDQPQTVEPIAPTRAFWQRAYAVALDDLSTLIAPNRVVICEGSPRVPKGSRNQSHDARCYDPIFEEEFPETRFISGGNASDVATDRFVLTEALGTLLEGMEVVRLIDRDDRSEAEIADELKRRVKVLSRRNLESFLFDDEVLTELAASVGKPDKLPELLERKAALLAQTNGAADDLKPICGPLYNACKEVLELTACGSTAEAFMRDTLARLVRPGMPIYDQLRCDIFGP